MKEYKEVKRAAEAASKGKTNEADTI